MPSLSHGLVKQGSFNQIGSFNSCDISDANPQTHSAFVIHVYPFPKATVPFYMHGEPYEAIHTRHLWYNTENTNYVNSVFEREKDVMCSESQTFSGQFSAAGGEKTPNIKVKSIFWMHLCLIAGLGLRSVSIVKFGVFVYREYWKHEHEHPYITIQFYFVVLDRI